MDARYSLSAIRFLARHAWSASLCALSAAMFWRLADEISEGELDAFDRTISGWFEHARGHVDVAMLFLTRLGAFWSMASICIASTMALVLRGRRWEGAYVLVCGAGAAVWCTALKLLFRRMRG